MSDSEGVIRIKGDNSDLDGKTAKSVEAMKQLGQHAQRAHGHARSFGEAMGHANQHLERSLIRGLSLAHVIKAAAEAAKEFQDEAAKASKSVGGSALKRDIAAKQLGLSSDQAEAAVSGSGAATAEERNSFFASLGAMKTGRGKQPLTQQQAFQLQSAFNSGLYSEDELKKIAETGDYSSINVGGRLAALGSDAQKEYRTRSVEYEAKERAEGIRSKSGYQTRAADAAIDARNAEHPFVGAVQGFVGKATSVVGGDSLITVGDRLLQKTEEQTDLIRKDANKPTLAPGAE
jgi:hypothetical protein